MCDFCEKNQDLGFKEMDVDILHGKLNISISCEYEGTITNSIRIKFCPICGTSMERVEFLITERMKRKEELKIKLEQAKIRKQKQDEIELYRQYFLKLKHTRNCYVYNGVLITSGNKEYISKFLKIDKKEIKCVSILTNNEIVEIKESISKLTSKQQYKFNFDAKVGDTIKCPSCYKEFTKQTNQQKFDTIRCKDNYWNKLRS